MGKLIYINEYKRLSRKKWFSVHGARLELFLEIFIKEHMPLTLEEAISSYYYTEQTTYVSNFTCAEFRDVLYNALEKAIGEQLNYELSQQWWSDSRWINQSSIIEQCLSKFILEAAFPTSA